MAPLDLHRSDSLTLAMCRLLWRIAQHKYGWGYISSIGDLSTARALARRGLLRDVSTDYEQATRYGLAPLGELEVVRQFPNSPAALHSYMRPEGGWSPRP